MPGRRSNHKHDLQQINVIIDYTFWFLYGGHLWELAQIWRIYCWSKILSCWNTNTVGKSENLNDGESKCCRCRALHADWPPSSFIIIISQMKSRTQRGCAEEITCCPKFIQYNGLLYSFWVTPFFFPYWFQTRYVKKTFFSLLSQEDGVERRRDVKQGAVRVNLSHWSGDWS